MVYDIILPIIPFVGGYLLTYSLYKRNLIRKSVHVSLWNLILFLAFLVSGGAGLILTILLELGVTLPVNQPLLFWHVEWGVTLVLVTIFHFHSHWKYTKTMFTSSKRRGRNEI